MSDKYEDLRKIIQEELLSEEVDGFGRPMPAIVRTVQRQSMSEAVQEIIQNFLKTKVSLFPNRDVSISQLIYLVIGVVKSLNENKLANNNILNEDLDEKQYKVDPSQINEFDSERIQMLLTVIRSTFGVDQDLNITINSNKDLIKVLGEAANTIKDTYQNNAWFQKQISSNAGFVFEKAIYQIIVDDDVTLELDQAYFNRVLPLLLFNHFRGPDDITGNFIELLSNPSTNDLFKKIEENIENRKNFYLKKLLDDTRSLLSDFTTQIQNLKGQIKNLFYNSGIQEEPVYKLASNNTDTYDIFAKAGNKLVHFDIKATKQPETTPTKTSIQEYINENDLAYGIINIRTVEDFTSPILLKADDVVGSFYTLNHILSNFNEICPVEGDKRIGRIKIDGLVDLDDNNLIKNDSSEAKVSIDVIKKYDYKIYSKLPAFLKDLNNIGDNIKKTLEKRNLWADGKGKPSSNNSNSFKKVTFRDKTNCLGITYRQDFIRVGDFVKIKSILSKNDLTQFTKFFEIINKIANIKLSEEDYHTDPFRSNRYPEREDKPGLIVKVNGKDYRFIKISVIKDLCGQRLNIHQADESDKIDLLSSSPHNFKDSFKSSGATLSLLDYELYKLYYTIMYDWDTLKKRATREHESLISVMNGIISENTIAKENILTENNIRLLVRRLLEEGDKKSYSGSHPEESYGWSAKEEDFMFDKPGLTTWEKDRQRVKEYLRSMGMLASKKEKKK
jgi:hypothetical protein